jgi:adenylate kinase
MPTKKEGVCDACGEALVQRDDDTEAVVKQRLDAYNAQTEPVVAYYREQESLDVMEIDGGKSPEEVTQAIVSALDALKGKG